MSANCFYLKSIVFKDCPAYPGEFTFWFVSSSKRKTRKINEKLRVLDRDYLSFCAVVDNGCNDAFELVIALRFGLNDCALEVNYIDDGVENTAFIGNGVVDDDVPKDVAKKLLDTIKNMAIDYSFFSMEPDTKWAYDNFGIKLGSDSEVEATVKKIYGILQKKPTLIVDEQLFEHLHPSQTKHAMKLLRECGTQFIFATKDISLMDWYSVPDEEVYLIDSSRNSNCAIAELFGLSDYDHKSHKKNTRSFYYLQGRFGGVPFIPNKCFI